MDPTCHTAHVGNLAGPVSVIDEGSGTEYLALVVQDHDIILASYPGSTSYRPSSATAALPRFR